MLCSMDPASRVNFERQLMAMRWRGVQQLHRRREAAGLKTRYGVMRMKYRTYKEKRLQPGSFSCVMHGAG